MSTIKKQSLYSAIFSYLGVVIGFISQGLLIPNLLTKDQNGLLGLLLSFMYIFVQLASLGFNYAGNRFFPSFSERKGYGGFIFTGLSISILGFLLASGILVLLKPLFLSSSTERSTILDHYFYLLLPISFGTILFNFFDSYSRNLFETVSGTFLNQFVQRLIILIGLLLIAVIGISFDVFIWIWTSAFIIPTIWMIIKSVQLSGFSLKPDFSVFTPKFRKEFINYSLLTILTGFSSMIIMYIDKIMLAYYGGLEDTGVYNTASFFGSIMGMSLIAMSRAAVPVIVNAFKNNDLHTIQTIYRKSCVMQVIIGCLIFGGILINLDSFFELIPQGYEEGKWVIIILGLGKLFDLATGLNGSVLALSKYYRYDSVIMISLIFLTIISNMLLIPEYKLIGAAMAAAISTFYYNSIKYWLVLKKLKMQPFDINFLKVIIVSSIIIAAAYHIPLIGGNVFNNLLDMAIRSSIFSIVFIAVIYKMRVSPEMNDIINRVLKLLIKS
ncbi:MAG: oligosaccharide flippase family protein [Sporocytophaga sp.]|nr:oligosaccharide flippase family protein [Sporocytophaga sp.]